MFIDRNRPDSFYLSLGSVPARHLSQALCEGMHPQPARRQSQRVVTVGWRHREPTIEGCSVPAPPPLMLALSSRLILRRIADSFSNFFISMHLIVIKLVDALLR